MARKPIPTYRRHPRKDRAVIDLYDAAGRRTQRLLPGAFGSPESQGAYQKLIGKLQAHGGVLPTLPGQELPDDLTIDEVVLRFMTEAAAGDGKQRLAVRARHADVGAISTESTLTGFNVSVAL